MKSFLIKELDQELTFDDFDFKVEGFVYKTKNSNIKEITIVNKEIIYGLISSSFNKKYKKLLREILLDDEDNDGDALKLALDEIARLRSILENKYKRFLKKQDQEKLLKKLLLLEKDIKIKLVDKTLKKEEKNIEKTANKGMHR